MNRPNPGQYVEPERYRALLSEAKRLQGVSLGRDAWRRLRRNYAAMASLTFLVVLSVLSLFAPLLPLQSPKEQDLAHRAFEHPNGDWHRLELEPLLPTSKQAPDVVNPADVVHPEFESPNGQRHRPEPKPLLSTPKAYDERVEVLWNRPNAFDRALVRARLAIFGDRCLPSLCGTDQLGRDLLSRLLFGSRVSLMVGIVATLVSLVIGVSYGAIAGYVGGWVDNAMMRLVDILYSIPFIFVVIFLLCILSEHSIKNWLLDHHIDKLVIFYLVIGAIFWLTMARVVRGQVISLKHEQFVEAARAIGASQTRIIFLHLVPNLLSVVIVYLTLTIPSVMLFEAFLSFLGLGVDQPGVSWGMLASDGVAAINPLKIYWWLVLYPGLALAMTLFALNFLGDGLRDALDPRLKNK